MTQDPGEARRIWSVFPSIQMMLLGILALFIVGYCGWAIWYLGHDLQRLPDLPSRPIPITGEAPTAVPPTGLHS